MQAKKIRELLEEVRTGARTVESALDQLRDVAMPIMPFSAQRDEQGFLRRKGFARIDREVCDARIILQAVHGPTDRCGDGAQPVTMDRHQPCGFILARAATKQVRQSGS